MIAVESAEVCAKRQETFKTKMRIIENFIIFLLEVCENLIRPLIKRRLNHLCFHAFAANFNFNRSPDSIKRYIDITNADAFF